MKQFNYLCIGLTSNKMQIKGSVDLLEFLEKETHTLPSNFADYTEEQKKEYKKRKFPYFLKGNGNNQMYLTGESFFTRKDDNLNTKGCITLDFDNGTVSFEEVKAKADAKGLKYALYSTISSREDLPRFRLVVPTDRGMNKETALKSVRALAEFIGVEGYDQTAKTFTQLQGCPIAETKDHKKPVFKHNGEPFSVDFIETKKEPPKKEAQALQGSEKNHAFSIQEKGEEVQEEKVNEFKNYLRREKDKFTEDEGAYDYALATICTIAKARKDGELNEATARKCLKLLAKGRVEWAYGNFEKYNKFLENEAYIKTAYAWDKRINYKKTAGRKKKEAEEVEEKEVYAFSRENANTVHLPPHYVVLDKHGNFSKVVQAPEVYAEFLHQNGVILKRNLYTKKIEAFADRDFLEAFDTNPQTIATENFLINLINLYREESTNKTINITGEGARALISYLGDKNLYNPVMETLESNYLDYEPELLEEFTELLKLFECFKITDENEEERAFLFEMLKKFLLQCVALADYEDGQAKGGELLPFLYSRRQGVGKSLFLRLLCERVGLLDYFKEDLNVQHLEQKDELVKWASCFIGEVAEFRQNKDNFDALKQRTTQSTAVLRLPYEKEYKIFPSMSNFVATTNNGDIFKEENNRRFPVFDIDDIDREKMLYTVDFCRVWAEIMHAYQKAKEKGKANICYRLTEEEKNKVNQTARKFIDSGATADIFAEVYDTEIKKIFWTFRPFTEVAQNCGVYAFNTQEYKRLKKDLQALGYEFKKGHASKSYIKVPPPIKK